MSIHQDIIDAIDIRLKTILISNSYNTDIGNSVFHWRNTNLTEADLPGIIYRDSAVNDKEENAITGGWITKFLIEIVGFDTLAGTTPARMRLITQDIYDAIRVDDLWGGLVHDTTPVSDEIDIQNKDKISGMASVIIEIDYLASKWIY
jgi:hypothetical protein